MSAKDGETALKTCSICGGAVFSRGLCNGHYKRLRRHGSPTGGRHIQSPRDRFEALYSPEPNSGCWIWTGRCNPQGYGSLVVKKKHWRAHRLSYLLHYGQLPRDLVVMHKCDNPYCVNPDHLVLGTLLENNKDRHAKGRDARGPGHGRSRLSVEIVNSIRSSERSAAELAELYGVHRTTIHRARKGWSWECI